MFWSIISCDKNTLSPRAEHVHLVSQVCFGWPSGERPTRRGPILTCCRPLPCVSSRRTWLRKRCWTRCCSFARLSLSICETESRGQSWTTGTGSSTFVKSCSLQQTTWSCLASTTTPLAVIWRASGRGWPWENNCEKSSSKTWILSRDKGFPSRSRRSSLRSLVRWMALVPLSQGFAWRTCGKITSRHRPPRWLRACLSGSALVCRWKNSMSFFMDSQVCHSAEGTRSSGRSLTQASWSLDIHRTERSLTSPRVCWANSVNSPSRTSTGSSWTPFSCTWTAWRISLCWNCAAMLWRLNWTFYLRTTSTYRFARSGSLTFRSLLVAVVFGKRFRASSRNSELFTWTRAVRASFVASWIRLCWPPWCWNGSGAWRVSRCVASTFH